jgi:uncharacterized membrane protein YebE (DUF533 family)
MFEKMSSDDVAGLLGFALMLAFVVLGAAVVAWALYWDWRKKQLLYEERRAMLEKGMAPPPLPTSFSIPGQLAQVKQELQKLKFDERRLMIEKGMVPPELPDEDQIAPKTPAVALSRGTLLFFGGIGLEIAAFSIQPTNDLGKVLLFVAPVIGMVGLGYLVYYRFAKGRKPEAGQEKSL